MNIEKAKETWNKAGLNPQGVAAVSSWIDTLTANITAGAGRWDAYEKFAFYTGTDPMGSVKLLKQAVDQTSK